MKYLNGLIAVADVDRSRKFYETVLDQELEFDFGEHVSFKSGLAIQLAPHFAGMIHVEPQSVVTRAHNFELYFEDDEIEAFAQKIQKNPEITCLHALEEAPWGQRVIRFYDPDQHVVEVAESMVAVVVRFKIQGMTNEEISEKTMFPPVAVEQILAYKPS